MPFLAILFFFLPTNLHDLHLSMCNVNYNGDHQRIEIQQRIFYDDLEKSLRHTLDDEKFDILLPALVEQNYDSLFHAYLNEHLSLEINNQVQKLNLLEYEIQEDAIVFYLYVQDISSIESISYFSSILFELFDDQNNVVSIKIGERKKSGKFKQGSKALSLKF